MSTDPHQNAFNLAIEGQYAVGLTKRELFTLVALFARLRNEQLSKEFGVTFNGVSEDCVGWADAVIKELNQFKPEVVKDVPMPTKS